MHAIEYEMDLADVYRHDCGNNSRATARHYPIKYADGQTKS